MTLDALVAAVARRRTLAVRARIAVRAGLGAPAAALALALLARGLGAGGGAADVALAAVALAGLLAGAIALLAPDRAAPAERTLAAAIAIDRALALPDIVSTTVTLDAGAAFAPLLRRRAADSLAAAGERALPGAIGPALLPAETGALATAILLLGAAVVAMPAPDAARRGVVEVAIDWTAGSGGGDGEPDARGPAGPGARATAADNGDAGDARPDTPALAAEEARALLAAVRDGRIRLVAARPRAQALLDALEAPPGPTAPDAKPLDARERAALAIALRAVLARAADAAEHLAAQTPPDAGAGSSGASNGDAPATDGARAGSGAASAGDRPGDGARRPDASPDAGGPAAPTDAGAATGGRARLTPRLARIVTLYFEGGTRIDDPRADDPDSNCSSPPSGRASSCRFGEVT